MEFKGYMENAADLIARVKQLEETLVWKRTRVEGYKSDIYQLQSTVTKRIVMTVRVTDGGNFKMGDGAQYRDNDYEFFELEGALAAAKFTAIRNLLEEDLRRTRIQ